MPNMNTEQRRTMCAMSNALTSDWLIGPHCLTGSITAIHIDHSTGESCGYGGIVVRARYVSWTLSPPWDHGPCATHSGSADRRHTGRGWLGRLVADVVEIADRYERRFIKPSADALNTARLLTSGHNCVAGPRRWFRALELSDDLESVRWLLTRRLLTGATDDAMPFDKHTMVKLSDGKTTTGNSHAD